MIKSIDKRAILSLLLGIIFCPAYTLDCKSFNGSIGEKRKANFEISDVVLLGVITQIDENCVAIIKVSEIYKGKTDSISVVKFNNFINQNDIYCLWLIYGNKNIGSDTIFVNECSFSRSVNGVFGPPPPPPIKTNKNSMYSYTNEYYNSMYENRLLFFEEIEVLRIISNFD